MMPSRARLSPRLLGLGLALGLVLVLGLLFGAKTTTSASVSVGGCMPGGLWMATSDALPPPDASFERVVRDGETVEVTHPAGRYAIVIEGEGVELRGGPPPWTPSARGSACPDEPRIERLHARGDGTMRVSYWLLD